MILLIDHEPIVAAPSDAISADNGVVAAHRKPLDPEADADRPSVNDNVVGDEVAASAVDADALRVFASLPDYAWDPTRMGDAVSGDHVSRCA